MQCGQDSAKGMHAPAINAVLGSETNDKVKKVVESASETRIKVECLEGELGSVSPPKRPRSPKSDNENQAQKRARTEESIAKPERIRYTLDELFGLRHSRRLAAINGHVISKHAHEHAGMVASSGELVLDKSGRLRTSDVLVGVGEGEVVPTFADMQLPSTVVAGLAAVGFTRPSAVQHRGVPVARLGVDVIAQAKSGTGKTGVFATVVTECALPAAAGKVVAIVLAPGREVSRQIGAVLSTVLHAARLHAHEPNLEVGVEDVDDSERNPDAAKSSGAASSPAPSSTLGDVAVLVGGAPDAADAKPLRTATVAVGTPARVRALLAKGILDARAVKMLVLDEADRLLNAGAGFDLADVAGFLPPARQTLAFSATYTPALVARLRAIMRSPCLVWLGDQGPGGGVSGSGGDECDVNKEGEMWRSAVLRGVRQARIDVNDASMKRSTAIQLLHAVPYNSCIIFVARRDTAREVAKRLKKSRITARHVSAAMSNAQRKDALDAFKSGTASVLVATDMLARGVSFDRCDLVLHIDVPPDTATYLHRVGRAGRFGKLGNSIVIVEPSQRPDLAAIESRIGHVPKFDYQNIPNQPPTSPAKNQVKNSVISNDKNISVRSPKSPPSNLGPEASSAPPQNVVTEGESNENIFPSQNHGEASQLLAEGSLQNDDEAGYAAGYELARKLIERIHARTAKK